MRFSCSEPSVRAPRKVVESDLTCAPRTGQRVEQASCAVWRALDSLRYPSAAPYLKRVGRD